MPIFSLKTDEIPDLENLKNVLNDEREYWDNFLENDKDAVKFFDNAIDILDKNKEIYSEDGEVQFRSDAISGIVVFNIAFMINKINLQANTTTIKIDFGVRG